MATDDKLHGEEAIIRLLAPLAQGIPGAFGLEDDCALITPTPGKELVLKTDPVAQGVHFLADDAPEDIAWKALAVNVSDLAAKAGFELVNVAVDGMDAFMRTRTRIYTDVGKRMGLGTTK